MYVHYYGYSCIRVYFLRVSRPFDDSEFVNEFKAIWQMNPPSTPVEPAVEPDGALPEPAATVQMRVGTAGAES